MPDRKKAPIGGWAAFALIAVALLCDSLQFLATLLHALPGVGSALSLVLTWFLTVLALIIFSVWFALLGVNYFSGKRAAWRAIAMFGVPAAEIIPLINALPAVTAGVALMIASTYDPDEALGFLKKVAPAGKAITDAQRRAHTANPAIPEHGATPRQRTVLTGKETGGPRG